MVFFHATRCGREGELDSANIFNACISSNVFWLGPGIGTVRPPANCEGALLYCVSCVLLS